MKGDEWERIRRNRERLKDVQVKEILPYLHQCGVVDQKDRENLNAISANEERMDKLCELLKEKPSDKNSYKCLMEALAKADTPYLHEIARIIESTETKSDSTVTSKGVCEAADIKTLTPSQLKLVLQRRFHEEDLPTELLDELEIQKVSGKLLLTMTEVDLKEIMPTSLFAARRTIALFIEEYKMIPRTKIDSIPEILREFDKDVQPGDFYIQGRLVDVNIDIRGRKTSPVKNFHVLDDQTEHEKCEYIAVEIIQFAAACMNQRRSGTIYFGISPENNQIHKAGEIVGMTISKDKLHKEMDSAFTQAFRKEQMKIIKRIIQPLKFVAIHTQDKVVTAEENKELWLIECDIVLSNSVLENETIVVDPKPFPCLRRKHKVQSCIFSFSDDGKPKVLNFEEERAYNNTEKGRIIAQREEEERTKEEKETPNLRDQLHNLVTGGCPTLVDNIYPFLMLGPLPPEVDNDVLKEQMSFVKYLHPEVVFDFNEKGSKSGIYHSLDDYENFRVLTTDNFDSQKSSKEEIQKFSQSLASEKTCSWVFCNGDEPNEVKPLSPNQWNKERKYAFQEALRSHLDIFKKQRILLIICLFLRDEGVIVEGSDEILTHLPDQWILLAESKRIAQTWQEIILQQNKSEQRDVVDRSVVGLTWGQVSSCFKDWCKNTDFNSCQIPHSNGSFIEVKEKLLKRWLDAEILSATDPINPNEDDHKVSQMAKEVEEHFYRGGQVEWLNFWFKGQVLERSIYPQLKKEVEKALCGNMKDDLRSVTSSVFLFHQPGAGGTTVARHILWQLRKEYRCCVVLDVTDQTVDQLTEIYHFNDNQPKPLLLLLDNIEDEKLDQLRLQLEITGRKIQARYEGVSEIFCVLLICLRYASLPLDKHSSDLKVLRQELDHQELSWFRIKYADLEKKFSKKKTNVNPKFLISFNLLKENFDRQYLQHVVQEFSNEITAENELMIMKVVSLLNTFDADFSFIPVSCFDILHDQQKCIYENTFYSVGKLSRRTNWEAGVSEGFKVLLNLSSGSNQNQSGRRNVRVFNKILAEEILESLRGMQNLTINDLMLWLLRSRLFKEDNRDVKTMQKIIRNVIVKRQHKQDGHIKKAMFSNLIMYVKENEGTENALIILKTSYDVIQDPVIAQLIARFYIELKNYQEAERYASYASMNAPKNSFIWHTYGQVFFNQLMDKIECKKSSVSSPLFSILELPELIHLFQHCLLFFRKSQDCAECERESYRNQGVNIAGYLDELRSCEQFLNALERFPCFQSKPLLHRFLTEYDFKHPDLKILKPAELNCIKKIVKDSEETIQRLEDELISPKFERNYFKVNEVDANINALFSLKIKLNEYFGEKQVIVPNNLSEENQCEFRYRHVISKLPFMTLKQLLRSFENKAQPKKFFEGLLAQMVKNVESNFCCFRFLKTLLDLFTVFMVKEKRQGVPLEVIQNYARKLCFSFESQAAKIVYPEKYFYFIIYKFPTEERQISGNDIHDLSSALQNLNDTFMKKYTKNDQRFYTEMPLFYLGNKAPFHHLIHHWELKQTYKGTNLRDLWHLPQICGILKLFSGTLQQYGNRIKFHIKTNDNSKHLLEIQTLIPIKDRNLWQKHVFFYIGFSFAGLMAVGVTPNNPNE